MSSVSSAEQPGLRLRFGAGDHASPALPLPVLAGVDTEDLFSEARPIGAVGPFELFGYGSWLLGRACGRAGPCLEATTRQRYEELLRLSPDHALLRVWNYVPAINEASPAGLENYRAFCRGRSLAFEQHLGPTFAHHACAASAVGSDGADLVIAFAAFRGAVRHVENPSQTPAYDYPAEHGPRAPTFARASVADLGGGAAAVFVSGTSSILGHTTIAAGDTVGQLRCTIENLRGISSACGLGCDLGAGRAPVRYFKVYLRRAEDLIAVRSGLEATLLQPGDRVTYLRADICRRELNLEIEVSLPMVRPG